MTKRNEVWVVVAISDDWKQSCEIILDKLNTKDLDFYDPKTKRGLNCNDREIELSNKFLRVFEEIQFYNSYYYLGRHDDASGKFYPVGVSYTGNRSLNKLVHDLMLKKLNIRLGSSVSLQHYAPRMRTNSGGTSIVQPVLLKYRPRFWKYKNNWNLAE